MNVNKILKTLNQKEEKLLDAIEEYQTFLDTIEDEELSSMGDEFSNLLVDFFHSNDTVNSHDIKEFIESELSQE